MKDYLNYCEAVRRLDTKTLRAYRCDLEQFILWLGERRKGLNKEALCSYIAYLNSRYAVSSVKRKLASIKAFAFYVEENRGEKNPFYGMRLNIKEPRRLPRTIPKESLNKLFATLYASVEHFSDKPSAQTSLRRQFSIARDRVIFELMIATGLRVSELCSLDTESLSTSDKTLRIMGKGAKERILQIENENTTKALNVYTQNATAIWPEWKKQTKTPLLLNRFGKRISDQSIRSIVKRWALAAGLKGDITPHMFRHSFATLLLEDGVDIRYIQHFLGHSSIQTTEIYTHVTSPKMRDILRLNNPRACLCAGV
ncbi:MAG: tyrosine-type recombinase/integrase [Coriobacteriales bacterium]|nr:tyrosine-type recombinase/integrase [Coriobacteriales bacterium]